MTAHSRGNYFQRWFVDCGECLAEQMRFLKEPASVTPFHQNQIIDLFGEQAAVSDVEVL
jgi:hypothetical protein